MNIFFEEHRELLQNLINFKVEFILIGGYAVNYYGYNRSTGDMDIWLQPDNENKLLLLNSFRSMGFDEEGIATIFEWDFAQPHKFTIGEFHRPDKTEFMTHISGVDYHTADKAKIVARIDGLELPVIHINNLITNKKATGRAKDSADVDYLERILDIKRK